MKPREKHVWTWPIAGYLFLGGLGSAMSVVVAVADLFFGRGAPVSFCLPIAVVALGAGSFLLIFELGRPTQFWRVFSQMSAVLNFGAWMVSLLIVVNLAYFSCFVEWFPWFGAAALRVVCAVVTLLLGCGVLMYTGVELSSMKGRLLWNTPLLPVLFSLSGLVTGLAASVLCTGMWPYGGDSATAEVTASVLRASCIGFVVMTTVATFVYVLMIYTSTGLSARRAIKRWLFGSYALPFWGGLILAGLLIPLVLFALDNSVTDIMACVLLIIGGAFLRFLVVYSDDRQLLSGEDAYWDHLPHGDEPFIDRNWG